MPFIYQRGYNKENRERNRVRVGSDNEKEATGWIEANSLMLASWRAQAKLLGQTSAPDWPNEGKTHYATKKQTTKGWNVYKCWCFFLHLLKMACDVLSMEAYVKIFP